MKKIYSLLIAFILLVSASTAAATDSVTVNASFAVPSWISLSIIGNGDVDFGLVDVLGAYPGDNTTRLLIISTSSWSVTSSIDWLNISTSVPIGAHTTAIDTEFAYSSSGLWGAYTEDVTYIFNVYDPYPVGNYNMVLIYTATTD